LTVEELIGRWAALGALIIDYGAVLLVTVSALIALGQALFALIQGSAQHVYRPIRWMLARRLTMALELMIASDIIRTAVNASWLDLGQLAAIIILRELINYTLNRDINESAALQGSIGNG
jgi:uncharacterized membrane protein